MDEMIKEMEHVLQDNKAYPDVPFNVLELIMQWRKTLKKMQREET